MPTFPDVVMVWICTSLDASVKDVTAKMNFALNSVKNVSFKSDCKSISMNDTEQYTAIT